MIEISPPRPQLQFVCAHALVAQPGKTTPQGDRFNCSFLDYQLLNVLVSDSTRDVDPVDQALKRHVRAYFALWGVRNGDAASERWNEYL